MSGTVNITTLYGELTAFDGDLISSHLSRFGEWAPFESQIARSVLKAGQTAIDAGAFIGTFSLSLLASEPKSVCAVEVNPTTFSALKDNANRLGGEVIKPELGALGLDLSAEKSNRVLTVNPDNLGGTVVVQGADSSVDAIEINLLTLSDLRQKHGDYDLVKLDLEGYELSALKADQSYLHKVKPFLMIEANDTPETCQIANYCRWLGYEVAFVNMPVWREDNPNGAVEPFFALAHESMLIASRPGDMPDPPHTLLRNGGRFIPIKNTHDVIEALWSTPRWSTANWDKMSREELIAVLGKLEKGLTKASYHAELNPQTPFGDM